MLIPPFPLCASPVFIMNLDSLTNFIYHQSIPYLIRWSIISVLISAVLYRSFGKRCWWKPVLIATLCIWTAAVLVITVLSRDPGGTYSLSLVPLHSYLEILGGGSPELLRSNFMNMLLFFPAGVQSRLLLTESSSPRRKFTVIAAVFFCSSLSIETTQYLLAVGHFEVDDILHNILGAVGGYVLCGWALGNLPPTID